jgi:two-component system, cell cycle sensor histidine kinase and response regulator CckA
MPISRATPAPQLPNRSSITPLPEVVALMEEAESLANFASFVTFLGSPPRAFWSRHCYRVFGFDPRDPITLERFLCAVHPDDLPRVLETREGAIERDLPYDIRYRILRADGEVRWVHTRAVVTRDAAGRAVKLSGVFKDITEEQRIGEELKASEARYRRIVETTSQGVWTLDPDLKTTFMNRRLIELLGHSPAEVLGRPASDFVDPGTIAFCHEQSVVRRKAPASQVEVPLRRKDGVLVWTLLEPTPILDAAGGYDGCLVMVTDISERRKAEKALHASETRFARLAECGIIGIAIIDLAGGGVHDANEACLRMLGYTREDLASGTLRWQAMASPEWAEITRRSLEQVRASGRAAPFEHELVRKDGGHLPVLMGGATLDEDDHCIIFLADLSELKSAKRDLVKSEEQFRQAQKMEAIGRLAGGVAHDFNNVLSVILSYAELILDSLDEGDPLCDDVQQIKQAGDRAVDLTRHLLAFSRRQVLVPEIIGLNAVVSHMAKILRRLVGEDVEIEFRLDEDAGSVNADRGQIEQAIMNLVVNARDAMPNGGTLTIETSNVELDGAGEGSGPRGSFVRLSVSDTGIGMEEETISRIFEPFFTTKPKDKGTGLGLSTVLGIVQQSGGQITVASEPKKGARFDILLPRHRASDAVQAPDQAPVASTQGSETILLVEDEEAVRLIASRALRSDGYRVLEASNAGEALLIAEEHGSEIDLLLTDVVMPRLSGPELAERLKRTLSKLPVLYISGYPGEALGSRGILTRGVNYLKKPFRPDSLRRKVREVLDSRADAHAS